MRSWTENGARFYAIPSGGGGAEAVVGALAIAGESVYVRAT